MKEGRKKNTKTLPNSYEESILISKPSKDSTEKENDAGYRPTFQMNNR